jgi:predicted nucleotidyltransferase
MHELEALAAVVRTAASRRVPVLLIGAMARAIVFDLLAAGSPYRATRDIDFGVRVPTWDAYSGLVEALIAVEGFTRIGPHKLRYRDGSEIDLVPFGGVADAAGNVAWGGGDRAMSVLGFEAARAHRETHALAGVRVDVVNLGGLLILKLYALRDRLHQPGATDLRDIDYVLTNATAALHDRVFDELPHEALLELDYAELGPRLLAVDVSSMTDSAEVLRLIAIIDECVLTPPDYIHLARASVGGDVGQSRACFEAFRRGLVNALILTSELE